MKNYLLTFILLTTISIASIPNTISWQGVITDSEGELLTGNYNITVKIFDAHTAGNELWSETHNSVNVYNGLVNLILGSVEEFDLNFTEQYWLEIKVGDGTPLSRIALNTVPYSFYSKRSSGVIEADSLVLKDSEGVTRFVINPETGTFKMMDNDTIWYELSVNSPLKTRNVYGDGTFTVIQNGKEATFNRAGDLLHDRDRTSYDNDNGKSGSTENKKFYDQDSNVVLEQILQTEYDDTEIIECETHRFYSDSAKKDGEIIIVRNQNMNTNSNNEVQTRMNFNNDGDTTSKYVKKFENGIITKEEKYQNGTKVSETNYGETKSDNSILNPNGTVNRTITKYSDQLKWEISSGNQNSNVSQDQNSWQFKNNSETSSFQIQSASGNGYKIGLDSNNPSTPAMQFIANNNGGEMSFQGNAVFNDSLKANGYFNGENGKFSNNLDIEGDLNVQGNKNFKIQHPLYSDKYLYHSCIESNEVLNKYSGIAITDETGRAEVVLPDYFDKINRNYRYQLTVIGTFSQAIISKEIENNKFEISTDQPNVKVSWEITAERYDQYLKDNPFQSERDK